MDKIAICITTRNRKEAFAKSIQEQLGCLPAGAALFVVNDAGEPTSHDTYRFAERVGIPRAKNKCLELAMEWGASEIFLFDDDCYPLQDGWELPYISSPFQHLCFTFLPHNTVRDGHKYHYLGNGCMLYMQRGVPEKIGGFDTAFGIGKYEHTQFSHRAHYAGFCPTPYVDVIGSSELLYSMDQYGEVQRSLTQEEMDKQLSSGLDHFYATLRSGDFMPYV